MSFQVDLKKTKSETTQLTKVMETGGTSLSGTLINNSNVINPSILCHVSAETVAGYNYMEIGAFNRKYFITEITALTHDTCMVQGHVDVLSTYAGDIRNLTGVIARQENKYNLYLDDNLFKVDSRTIIQTVQNNASGG
ncbi:MAG: hypothetical protein J6U97_01895 [Bacteroidaceae bacterium]|nr:hypothetical protein [Bacteroidaceae bacterium]